MAMYFKSAKNTDTTVYAVDQTDVETFLSKKLDKRSLFECYLDKAYRPAEIYGYIWSASQVMKRMEADLFENAMDEWLDEETRRIVDALEDLGTGEAYDITIGDAFPIAVVACDPEGYTEDAIRLTSDAPFHVRVSGRGVILGGMTDGGDDRYELSLRTEDIPALVSALTRAVPRRE